MLLKNYGHSIEHMFVLQYACVRTKCLQNTAEI